MSEYFDVLGYDRRPTGERKERGSLFEEGKFRQVVHLCIFDGDGRMLLQRRADDKPTWPGKWDVSVGGSVIAGESAAEGIAREAAEELGITIDPARLRPAASFSFPYGFDDWYLLSVPVDLAALAVPNEEVADVRWATEAEVMALHAKGEFVTFRESALHLAFDLAGKRSILDGGEQHLGTFDEALPHFSRP